MDISIPCWLPLRFSALRNIYIHLTLKRRTMLSSESEYPKASIVLRKHRVPLTLNGYWLNMREIKKRVRVEVINKLTVKMWVRIPRKT